MCISSLIVENLGILCKLEHSFATGISTFVFSIANTHQTSSDNEVWTE